MYDSITDFRYRKYKRASEVSKKSQHFEYDRKETIKASKRYEKLKVIKNLVGTQLDSDRRLLSYKTYEDYLDSLVTSKDLGYLRSTPISRNIAELGYRCRGETLARTSFHIRRDTVKELLYPVVKPYTLNSSAIRFADKLINFQLELSFRERPNRLGTLSTIIFLHYKGDAQQEVSSYIDYADRLSNEDWTEFFMGKKDVKPQKTDLSHCNWQNNRVTLNETPNYQPTMDEQQGLVFKNLHDRRLIYVNPEAPDPGIGTTRTHIQSDIFEHIVLYDHLLRSRA